MIVFLYPFLAVLLVLAFAVRHFFSFSKTQVQQALKIPFIKDLKKIESANKNVFAAPSLAYLKMPRFWFLFLIWALVVAALMRPVFFSEPIRIQNKGRDILMITDISTSMLEEDFVFQNRRISRIDAVKAVVSDFTKKRTSDRMGLVLFGARAYLQVPLTYDKKALLDVLDVAKAGMAGQSTAIGDALGLSLKALSELKTDKKNQVMILLTDGENNDGSLGIDDAIEMAKNEGVKVYTIGIGAPSLTMASVFFGHQGTSVDEKSLKALASETNGRFFKVKNLGELVDVYRQIDTLEAQDFEQNYIYPKKELYFVPLLLALILALCALLFERLKKGNENTF